MADYVWAQTGRILGYDAVSGADVPDELEALPSRAIARYLDKGYIQAKADVPEIDTSTLATDAEVQAFVDALDGRLDTVEGSVTAHGTQLAELEFTQDGTLPIEKIAKGTPSGKKFVRDDGTLAEVSGRLLSGDGPPSAGPSIRAHNGGNVAAGGISGVDVVIPAGVEAGDVIAVGVQRDWWTAWSAPAGYTQLMQDVDLYDACRAVFYKVADGTEGGTTVRVSAADNTGARGWVVAVIQGVSPTVVTASGNPLPSVDATADSIMVAFAFAWAAAATDATVSGMTLVRRQDYMTQQDVALYSEQREVGATGQRSLGGGNAIAGALILSSSSSAQDGDHYLDKTSRQLYGPLTAGAWGDPIPLDSPAIIKSTTPPADTDAIWVVLPS